MVHLRSKVWAYNKNELRILSLEFEIIGLKNIFEMFKNSKLQLIIKKASLYIKRCPSGQTKPSLSFCHNNHNLNLH